MATVMLDQQNSEQRSDIVFHHVISAFNENVAGTIIITRLSSLHSIGRRNGSGAAFIPQNGLNVSLIIATFTVSEIANHEMAQSVRLSVSSGHWPKTHTAGKVMTISMDFEFKSRKPGAEIWCIYYGGLVKSGICCDEGSGKALLGMSIDKVESSWWRWYQYGYSHAGKFSIICTWQLRIIFRK